MEFCNEFERALEQEEFMLYLQPKYQQNSEFVYGAEVLVRWRHPEKGLLQPKDFLPACVAHNCMYKLDAYVWEHSCMLLKKWNEFEYHPCALSVKVSQSSLYNMKTNMTLMKYLEKYQIPIEMLQLEIEEDSIRADVYQAKEAINYLHESGFTILLDDFSYGCSSISALNQIDVDILKVDMKFFPSCSNGGKAEVILASIIKSANWLGMSVLAECVETKQQNDFAKACDCQFTQGFFYEKPLSAERFEKEYLAVQKEQLKVSEKEVTDKPKHNLSILVIDDSEMERELLFKYLKKEFYVHLCENAEMGLAFLKDHEDSVDLILVDYLMPGMNGIEFLQFCHADEKWKRIPKIMITSNDRAKEQILAFQAGAYDYLLKPLIPELVQVRIRHALELNDKLQMTVQEKEKYQRQAETDKATGLLNKITFETNVEDHLSQNKEKISALLIFDIDDFKNINDTQGHLMGDEVIKLIADILVSHFRTTDYVGRFGGDEFTVYMMELPDKQLVEKKILTLLEAVKEESRKKFPMQVSVSAGASFSKQDDHFEELFARADGALYKVKNSCKGSYSIVE